MAEVQTQAYGEGHLWKSYLRVTRHTSRMMHACHTLIAPYPTTSYQTRHVRLRSIWWSRIQGLGANLLTKTHNHGKSVLSRKIKV